MKSFERLKGRSIPMMCVCLSPGTLAGTDPTWVTWTSERTIADKHLFQTLQPKLYFAHPEWNVMLAWVIIYSKTSYERAVRDTTYFFAWIEYINLFYNYAGSSLTTYGTHTQHRTRTICTFHNPVCFVCICWKSVGRDEENWGYISYA